MFFFVECQGHGSDVDYFEPTMVSHGSNMKALHVSCGFNHTGAIFEYIETWQPPNIFLWNFLLYAEKKIKGRFMCLFSNNLVCREGLWIDDQGRTHLWNTSYLK